MLLRTGSWRFASVPTASSEATARDAAVAAAKAAWWWPATVWQSGRGRIDTSDVSAFTEILEQMFEY